MMKSKSFTVSCIFAGLNIVLLVAYIIFCLVNSYIISRFLVIITVVAALLSTLFILIKKLSNLVKSIITGIIFFVFFICFTFFNLFGGQTEFRKFEGLDEINAYNSEVDEEFSYSDRMIEIKRAGDFEEIIAYKYFYNAIFSDLAFTTIAKYDEQSFEKQKNQLVNEYKFNYTSLEDDERITVSFNAYGFDFSIVTDFEGSYVYPKVVRLIGINETSNEIAYVDFENYDLDYIDDYEWFISSYCGWEYIF